MIQTFLHNTIKGIIVATLMLPAVGCTSDRVNLVRDSTVKIKVSDCHRLTISAQVERDGNETIVSGLISRSPPLDLDNIHIDVTMTLANGETVQAVTKLAFPRTYISRRSHQWRFAVWFPFVPPRGSQVYLKCDASPHSEAGKR